MALERSPSVLVELVGLGRIPRTIFGAREHGGLVGKREAAAGNDAGATGAGMRQRKAVGTPSFAAKEVSRVAASSALRVEERSSWNLGLGVATRPGKFARTMTGLVFARSIEMPAW